MTRLDIAIWSGVAALAILLFLIVFTAAAHAQVQCRYVPNGSNITISCSNGFWRTVTPEGEEFTGNGVPDPSASAAGSTIVINPATGGPAVGAGPTVTPPTQQLPMLAPYQAEQYGFQPRRD